MAQIIKLDINFFRHNYQCQNGAPEQALFTHVANIRFFSGAEQQRHASKNQWISRNKYFLSFSEQQISNQNEERISFSPSSRLSQMRNSIYFLTPPHLALFAEFTLVNSRRSSSAEKECHSKANEIVALGTWIETFYSWRLKPARNRDVSLTKLRFFLPPLPPKNSRKQKSRQTSENLLKKLRKFSEKFMKILSELFWCCRQEERE